MPVIRPDECNELVVAIHFLSHDDLAVAKTAHGAP